MPHFAIFDRNAGLYQWGGEYSDHEAALADFDRQVGIDPHGKGLAQIASEFRVLEVTPDQIKALERWAEGGFKSHEFPPDIF